MPDAKTIPDNRLPSDERNAVLKYNLFCVQVCSFGTEDEALEWVRAAMPAGTSQNWMKSANPEHKGVDCANTTGRTHYLFQC
jgi:hypothetical protein